MRDIDQKSGKDEVLRQLLADTEDVKAEGYVLYLRRSVPQKTKIDTEGNEVLIEDEKMEKVDRISIQQQKIACIGVGENRKLTIVKTFEEEKTAKLPDNREVFSEMLKYLEANPGLGVFAWAPDRLSRNALDAGRLIQMHIDHHIIDFQFVTYHFRHDSSGLEYLMMEFARAMGYSLRLGTTVKRGMMQKYHLDNEWQFPDKFGYRRLLKTKRSGEKKRVNFLVPVRGADGKLGEFEVMQLAFEKRLLGWTFAKIADHINSIGFVTRKGKAGKMTDKKLCGYKKRRGYLKDPFYCGTAKMKWGEMDLKDLEELDDSGNRLIFEPAVTETDFELCKEINKREERPVMRKHDSVPLREIVRCGDCGYALVPQQKKGNIYYYCMHKGCKGTRPHAQQKNKTVNNGIEGKDLFEKIENIFKKDFRPSRRELTAYLLYIEKMNRFSRERKDRDLKSIRSSRGNLQRLIEQSDDVLFATLQGVEKTDTRNGLIKSHEATLGKRKAELARLVAKETQLLTGERPWTQDFTQWLELTQNAHLYWKGANLEQKKRIAEEIFLELVVKNGILASYRCKDEYKALLEVNLSCDGGPGWT